MWPLKAMTLTHSCRQPPLNRLPRPGRRSRTASPLEVLFGAISPRIPSHFAFRLIGSVIPVPPGNTTSPPDVQIFRTVPLANTLVRRVGKNAFAAIVPARPCPVFGRPIRHGVAPSTTARYFSASPSDSTSIELLPWLSPPFPASGLGLRLSAHTPPLIWRPSPERQWDFTSCPAHTMTESDSSSPFVSGYDSSVFPSRPRH